MKAILKWLLLIGFSIHAGFCQETHKTAVDSNVIKGPYLGQQPPGMIPKLFAPGIVSTENYEYGGVFTPDLKEFYFMANGGKYKRNTLVVFQFKNDNWNVTTLSPWVGQPMFSSDGNTMYLGRRFRERTNTGWSEIKSLEDPFQDQQIMRLSVTDQGSCYFDTYDKNNPEFPIRYSRLINGVYQKPRALGKEINTGSQLNHPFIAPDESYIIWDAIRKEGYGDSDLYISFKQPDGSWSEAINLGSEINTDSWEAAANVTSDGKYLFFSRNMGSKNYENVDIFWVNTRFLDFLNPNKQSN